MNSESERKCSKKRSYKVKREDSDKQDSERDCSSKRNRSRSKHRNRSSCRDRRRSLSRGRKRHRSGDHKRHYSKDRKRHYSKDRKRHYSKDHKRHYSKDCNKNRSKDHSRDSKDKHSNRHRRSESRNSTKQSEEASSSNFESIAIDQNKKVLKRKSRWGEDENEKIFVPGVPSIMPCNLSKEQEEAYLLELNVREIGLQLRSKKYRNVDNCRSPSPEPIYNSDGTRLNTREYRIRSKLENEQHQMVLRLKDLNPNYIPPPGYIPKLSKLSDKVLIPQENHPDINFIGLLIGPRGNTLKKMEQDTGAKIIIRGRGSVKEGKTANATGLTLPGQDEPLHAYITASSSNNLKKAIDTVNNIIDQGIAGGPNGDNELRKLQLQELATLNGTNRESTLNRCVNCGALGHKSWLCPEKSIITNSIVCNTCGGSGHIAKDCKIKKNVNVDQLKGPEEINSLEKEYLAFKSVIDTPQNSDSYTSTEINQKHSNNNSTRKIQNQPRINAIGSFSPNDSIQNRQLYYPTTNWISETAPVPLHLGMNQWQVFNQGPIATHQYSWPYNFHNNLNFQPGIPDCLINSFHGSGVLPPPPPPPPLE